MAQHAADLAVDLPLKAPDDGPLTCIDPALSAQLMLLRRMPRQGFACSAPDEGAGG
jgi:hypothetical protein